MPTPVPTARQCLTQEAANALDDAVNVARRRAHAQTTSLHVVSALLSLPSSSLRDACARARNSAYTPRLQFKALELCLSVSLDRVQSSQLTHNTNDSNSNDSNNNNDNGPPVSNSLMAAIKRAQANQRRQPENFHFYPQQQNQSCYSPSISSVKVELRNLILSILDDPVVSRVFGESGFRSSEIKLAILRPLPHVSNFSRYKGPPMFLCNLSQEPNLDPPGLDPGRFNFELPFPGHLNEDENCRRIGEVLMRSKGRNPMLVGVCAYDALVRFCEAIEQRKESSFLPGELLGLNVVCIESDVKKFLHEKSSLNEIDGILERNLGQRLVVNFGDLKVFDSGDGDSVKCVVEKLTRLLKIRGGKLWFIGASANYEMYLNFVSRFHDVEKDWDLQLLPITSLKSNLTDGSFPAKSSLMKSFVPLGGFFSTPPDMKGSLSSQEYQTCCPQCNQKCQQEVQAVISGEITDSIADQYQSSLPSWLQTSGVCKITPSDMKIRDDGVVLTTKVAALRKKWATICQRLHHNSPSASNSPSPLPPVMSFQLVKDKKEDAEKCSINDVKAMFSRTNSEKLKSSLAIDLPKTSREQLHQSFPVVCQAKTLSNQSKQCESSLNEDIASCGLKSASTLSNSSIGECSRASTASVSSVTTDLGLRIRSYPINEELKKQENKKPGLHLRDIFRPFSTNVEYGSGSTAGSPGQSSSFFSPEIGGPIDSSSFKILCQTLSEKVGWQNEAIRAICQTISCRRSRTENFHGAGARRDIWFNFVGPDNVGKKKVATALAEVIYGNKENFISADLSIQTQTIFNYEGNSDNAMYRGKTLVDFISGELGKKPLSIVFLENVDKADVQAQNSLSHAIQTAKFPDSHGREVGISNAIFVMTSTFSGENVDRSTKSCSVYSEERILQVKGRPFQMLFDETIDDRLGEDFTLSLATTESISRSLSFNKRKMATANQSSEENKEDAKRAHTKSIKNIDLNFPAEENFPEGFYDGGSDNDSISESSMAWLQNFFQMIDSTVVFKSFDFDALAQRFLDDINACCCKIIGFECSLDISPAVIEQLLASAYLSDKNRLVEDWIEQILSCGFVEVRKRLNIHSPSVVKLVTCDGPSGDVQQVQNTLLPPKIIVGKMSETKDR